MHGIVKIFNPLTNQGSNRIRELFGWAGRRKPVTFWYGGAGYDFSPICKIFYPELINSTNNSDFIPHIIEPELFIYTDGLFPNEEFENLEDIRFHIYNGLACYEFENEFDIIEIHELKINSDSELFHDNPFYKFHNGAREMNTENQIYQYLNLEKAYLVDIIVKKTNKVISVLLWRIGNMKFLKDVALSNKMNLDYMCISNLNSGGHQTIQGTTSLSVVGALNCKVFFITPIHLNSIDQNQQVELETINYLEDRMKFISKSNTEFKNFSFEFLGVWSLLNESVNSYQITLLDEILTFARQEDIRRQMLNYH